MTHIPQNRRQFLGAFAATTAAAPLAFSAPAHAENDSGGEFTFEVTRTEAEWRSMLSDQEYQILREFRTEPHFTSPLWNEERAGNYDCRGCGLRVYESDWKINKTIGWVFFFHSVPHSTMTSIDVISEGSGEEGAMPETMIETHCRRCGSHHGHILLVEGDVLHCINGTSLVFKPAA